MKVPVWMRQFNKRVTNPVMMAFSGKRAYFSVVHHVGRRSGHRYETPVIAEPTPDGFIIPLPYGDDTDWCLNVQAAGECQIWRRGDTYTVGEPEVVDATTALPAFPRGLRFAFRLNGVNQFLKVKGKPQNP